MSSTEFNFKICKTYYDIQYFHLKDLRSFLTLIPFLYFLSLIIFHPLLVCTTNTYLLLVIIQENRICIKNLYVQLMLPNNFSIALMHS